MAHGRRVRPSAVQTRVQGRLGWRRAFSLQHGAVEIDHQDFLSGQGRAARVAGLDENTVGARNARADVAAEVHDLLHHEQSRAGGKLLAQFPAIALSHQHPSSKKSSGWVYICPNDYP